MKYLLYYLLPSKVMFRMLYKTMGVFTCSLNFLNPGESFFKTTYIEYEEYKLLSREKKLEYLEKYLNAHKRRNEEDYE